MNLPLIPRFGIDGAALATLVADAVSVTLALAVVHTRLRAVVGRYALFALAVGTVYLCWLVLDGPAFYPVAAARTGDDRAGPRACFRALRAGRPGPHRAG